MASMANIDAKVSWWDRSPAGFFSQSREQVYRMRKSPFSSQRLDANLSERAPAPMKKSKGRSFEELTLDHWRDQEAREIAF